MDYKDGNREVDFLVDVGHNFQLGPDLLRPQFNKLLSLFQPFHSVRPQRLKPGKQCTIRTIPLPNPNQLHGLGAQKPVVNEIFIFADNDGVLSSGALPNRWIVGGLQTDVENVRGPMTLAGNPVCQRGRELRINDEVHARCKTA